MAARAHPTPQRGAGQPGGAGQLQPLHWALHWASPEDRQWGGLGQARQGCGSWALTGAAMAAWAVGGVGEGLESRGVIETINTPDSLDYIFEKSKYNPGNRYLDQSENI